MKTSTKVLLIITIALSIPQIFLTRYILAGIKPTGTGFEISFSTLAYVGLAFIAASTITSTILFFRFIQVQKLSSAIFFSVFPLTLVYGAFVSYISSINSVEGVLAQSVRATLNIGGENINYNGYLWSGVATLVYLVLLFVILLFMCRPVSKVGRAAENLSQGRLKNDNFKLGGGKQFQSIEHSLNRINYNLKEKSDRLKKVDFSKKKSVSKQFVRFMGKTDVLELECGHQVKRNACMLLCKLLCQEEVKNDLSLEENFNFLNSYIKLVLPLVKKYGGFVDKYLGDGVLAVFEKAENAIECGHSIIREVARKNRMKKDVPSIEVSLSLHYAMAVFGLEENEKMKPTIVSETIDKLQKIQEINSFIGAKMLFSQDVVNALPQKFSFDHRFVGGVTLDEKETSLYESLQCYPKRRRDKLLKHKNKFENAVQAFGRGKYAQAKELFAEILHDVPDDKASYVYFNSCGEKLSENM